MTDHEARSLRGVARGGAIGMVGAAVSALSGFLLVAVITNTYSKHVAGVFFSATSIFVVASAVTAMGTEAGLGRFLLRFEATRRFADIRVVLRAAFVPVTVVSVVVGLAMVAGARPIADLAGLDDDGAAIVAVLGVALPFAVVGSLCLATTRGFGQMRWTVFIDKIFRSAVQPVAALVTGLLGLGILALTIGWALAYVLAGVVAIVTLRRFYRRRAASYTDSEPPAPRQEVVGQFWSFTWPRSVAQVSQMVIQRADIIIIAALLGPASAAVYTAATRFMMIGQFGTQAVQQAVQPRFTDLIARGEHAALGTVFRISTAWSMAMAWPLYLVVGFAPHVYLSLFGSGYADDGRSVVLFMVAAMLFAVFSGPVDTLLLMSGRSTTSLFNSLVALTLDLVLCFVLVPRMGIVGAAIAWTVAIVTRCTLAFVQVHRMWGINPFCVPTLIVASLNAVCFAAPVALLSLTTDAGLLTLCAVAVAGGVAYLAGLWFFRKPLMLSTFRALRARRPSPTPSEVASR